MPPFQKNFSPHAFNETHATTHKNYAPLPWEAYFEELYYLSDVLSLFLRAHPSFKLEKKELYSFASTVQDYQLLVLLLLQNRSRYSELL